MQNIERWGYMPVAPDDLARGDVPRRGVVLTFDDGYEDFYFHAFPVLADLGHTATVYIVAGHICGTNAWDEKAGFRSRKLLTRDQIVEMHRHGIIIGSHSLTHARLTDLGASQLRKEVSESKAILEDLLGDEITTFAYPSGAVNERVRNAVAEAGYRTAFTTSDGVNDWTDLLMLNRTSVGEMHSMQEIHLKLRTGRGIASHRRQIAIGAAKRLIGVLPSGLGRKLANSLRTRDAATRKRMWERRTRDLARAAHHWDSSA
jgi:peptidoglycan/xylan/chitin deacetylase (PgdA/CDA1 family)